MKKKKIKNKSEPLRVVPMEMEAGPMSAAAMKRPEVMQGLLRQKKYDIPQDSYGMFRKDMRSGRKERIGNLITQAARGKIK